METQLAWLGARTFLDQLLYWVALTDHMLQGEIPFLTDSPLMELLDHFFSQHIDLSKVFID